MLPVQIVGVLLVLSLISAGHFDKYSQGANSAVHELEDPFRILKVNQLWQKAKQNLPEKKLADLYADLQLHDKREGDLKKAKLTGLDDDGLKSAQVEAKFMDIVRRYGLNSHYKDPSKPSNEVPSKKGPQEEMTDSKLLDLWEQASASGFTENELKTLKQELQHHQMKLDEFQVLKDDFHRYQAKEHNEVESITFDIMDAQNKHIDLKAKHKELKENLGRLENMASDPELGTLDFSDIRVYQLWALAKKSNMSDSELNSLREELRHFEHRLKKHEYFQEQLSLSEKRLNNPSEDGDIPENHQHLEKKVKDYDHKIKKIHKDLEFRIKEAGGKHSEL